MTTGILVHAQTASTSATITTMTPTPTTLPALPAVALPDNAPFAPSATASATPTTNPKLDLTSPDLPSAILRRKFRMEQLTKKHLRAYESFSVKVTSVDANFDVRLVHASGQTITPIVTKTTDGDLHTITIKPPTRFKPGKYTLQITDSAGQTITQDFTWGVLAINPNKSIYLPGQTAKLSMAVLNETGSMVCDAKVTLTIKRPSTSSVETGTDTLSTTNGRIQVNPQCKSHDVTVIPDYEASYQTGEVGRYEMTLTANTLKGTYTIDDSFEVRASVPFDVERISATRIYPPKLYPMTFEITAYQDFTGQIQEAVPDNFTVIPPEEATSSAAGIKSFDLINIAPVSAPELAGVDVPLISLGLPFNGNYPMTSPFGVVHEDRKLQRLYEQFGLFGHDGVDYGLPYGTPVLAIDEGEVLFGGNGPYGNTVVIKHPWGQSFYGHLSVVKGEKRQKVTKGEVIGISGNSGISTGPHLHLGMSLINSRYSNGYHGKIDPLPYLGKTTAISEYSDKIITWNVSLKKGQKITLGYRYNAPKVSPQFYLVGPLKFVETKETLTNSFDSTPTASLSATHLLVKDGTKLDVAPAPAASDSGSPLSSQPSQTSKTPQTPQPAQSPATPIFQEARFWQIAADTNVILEQQINIIDQPVTQPGIQNGIAYLDPAVYSDTTHTGQTYYLEVVALVTSGSGSVEFTHSAGTGSNPTNGSTTTISGITATTWTRYRSAAFSPSAGNVYISNLLGTGISVNAARIIVVQSEAVNIVETETQIEIGNAETTTSTSGTNALANPKLWQYTSGNYDGTITAYFEATLDNTAAASSANAALFDMTTGSTVASSTVTVTGTGWQRQRSSAITLTNGDTYEVVLFASANTAQMANAKVILDQSTTFPTGITKLETYEQYINTNQSLTGTNTSDALAFATTNQAQIPILNQNNSVETFTINGLGYIYTIGGSSNSTSGQSTVYKSTINPPTGDAQTLATTSQGQLPLLRFLHASVNGSLGGTQYIWVLGGSSTTATTETSTVYRSIVNIDNADIHNFNTTTQGQIPLLQQQHTSVVTTIQGTNYIYLIGGSPDGAATISTVYKATIDTSANLGSFVTTSQGQIPALLKIASSTTTTVNGTAYVYLIGGTTGTVQSTVYKSTVNNSGDLGSFATTTQGQLPQIINASSSINTTIGGTAYVYVIGGTTGTVQSTVYRSTLSSSGNLGSFETTTQGQLPAILSNLTSLTTAINGTSYVYVIGGTTGTVQSSLYKSTIDTTANLASFVTTSQGQLPAILNNLSGIVANVAGTSYLYVIGGTTGTVQSSVYKSVLDANGNAGSFVTTSQHQLPAILNNLTSIAVVIGGTTYMYAIGGTTGTTQSTVYKAIIDVGPNLASFVTTSQAQLPLLRDTHTSNIMSITGTSYVYVVGGSIGTTRISTVYKAAISQNNLGSFVTTTQGQFPLLSTDASATNATIGGTTYIYVLGGFVANSVSTVYKAVSNATGDLGSFVTTTQGQLPTLAYDFTTVTATIGGTSYVYSAGGKDASNPSSNLYKSTINSSGDLGSFVTTTQGQMPQALFRHASSGITISGTTYLYIFGGQTPSNTTVSTVYKATIDGTGNLGSFVTTSQAQIPTIGGFFVSATITVNQTNYIYLITGGASRTSTVYKATIDGTANIGSFDTTSQGQLPTILDNVLQGNYAITIGGTSYLFFIGGFNGTAGVSTVYKSTIDSSGNLGSFNTTNQGQLPSLKYDAPMTIASIGGTSYIYVISGAPANQSTVYKSVFDSSANLQAFATTTQGQLPKTLDSHTSAVATANGTSYLYVIGGITGTGTGTRQSVVYKLTTNSSGDLGSFDTTSMGQLPVLLSFPSAVIASMGGTNYIYVLGGTTGTQQSTVYKATLTSSGNAGSFVTTSQFQLPSSFSAHNAKVQTTTLGTQYIYVVGGTTGTVLSTIYKSQINSVASSSFAAFGYQNLYESNNWANGTFTYYHEGTMKANVGATVTADLTPGSLGSISISPTDAGSFATTSQGQLPQLIAGEGASVSISGTNYVYMVGGFTGSRISTVYKSIIDSSANLGSFVTTSMGQFPQLANALPVYITSVNGTNYLYGIGGLSAARISTVYKVTINNSGNLGSFVTTTQGQLPVPLNALAVGNGTVSVSGTTYIYVVGGASSPTARVSTIYKATLNSSGDAGSFVTTSQGQLPAFLTTSAIMTATIGVSSYFYVLGGSIDASTVGSTVYKSTLDSSGNAGSFDTASQGQLPQNLDQLNVTMLTISGTNYVYVIGGNITGGTNKSTIYKAIIDSSGNFGSFNTTNQSQFPLRLVGITTVNANVGGTNYIYALGGGSSDGTGQQSTVYKSQIVDNAFHLVRSSAISPITLGNSDADLGSFNTTSQGQLVGNNQLLSTQTYSVNGTNYLYVIGGDNGTTRQSTVYKTTVSSAGNIGSFSTTSQAQLPQLLRSLSTFMTNLSGTDYIFVLGGQNASAYVSTVYKSAFDVNGNLGSFATTGQTQLPALLGLASSFSTRVNGSTYAYVIGGDIGGPTAQSTVYKAQLNTPAVGPLIDIGSFNTTTQGQLVQLLSYQPSIISTIGGTNYVYVIGGSLNGVGTATISSVYKATIDGTANLGSFVTTTQGQLPQLLSSSLGITATVGGTNYVYVVGGYIAAQVSSVYKATIDGTANLGSFVTTTQGQLPIIRAGPSGATSTIGDTSYIYVLGGFDGASWYSTVYKVTLSSSGNLGSFVTTTQGQLPNTMSAQSSASITIGGANYLYALGGTSASNVYYSSVYKATIDGTGNVGSFVTTTQGQIPKVSAGHTNIIATIGGTNYFYLFGGKDLSGNTFPSVYKATIDGTGNVGSFVTTSQAQLPQLLSFHSSLNTTIGGTNYMYLVGGTPDNTNSVSTVYQSALYDSGQNAVNFLTTSQGQLPQLLRTHSSVNTSISGTTYVYVLGGDMGSALYASTVYRATMDSSGNLGSFVTTSQGQLLTILGSNVAVLAYISGTNYIYVLGGTTATVQSTVYKAVVDSSGNVGSFVTTSIAQLPQPINQQAAFTLNSNGTDNLYVLGGSTGSVISTVYKTSINETAQSTEYDTELQTGQVNSSWLVITVTGLNQDATPTLDQLMRHGDWFSNQGVRQWFTF